MDEYIPSKDFVERTMRKIHEVSVTPERRLSAGKLRFNFLFAKYGYVAAAIVFGLINLARLYFGVFAPINCR